MKYFCEKYKSNKLKISQIKENKIIHRPTRDYDEFGNRIYEELQYESSFDKNLKGYETERLFAKLIDIFPFFLFFYYYFHFGIFSSFIYSIPFVMVIGAILETLNGITIGKSIFKLKVIDDNGNPPSFYKSLKRNGLCLINLFPTFTDFQDRAGVWGTKMNFNMSLNNKFCKTYIVKPNVLKKIKELLNEKIVEQN